MKEEEEANADSTVETEVPSLQRSLGAEAPGHQKVQPGAVEEQFEKKLEQSKDQLEEHAQDAAAHGEVEKVCLEETDAGIKPRRISKIGSRGSIRQPWEFTNSEADKLHLQR